MESSGRKTKSTPSSSGKKVKTEVIDTPIPKKSVPKKSVPGDSEKKTTKPRKEPDTKEKKKEKNGKETSVGKKEVKKETETKSKKESEKESESKLELEQLSNLKTLALLIKEIIECGQGFSQGSKKPKNLVIVQAEKYISALGSVNCKVGSHHILYKEFYDKHRSFILKSKKEPDWMLNLSIDIHLGKGTTFEKHKIILKLSIAYNVAYKMKEDIEKAKYRNENERQLALSDYKCQFANLLHYRILMVVIDALGPNHNDIDKLTALSNHFRMEAGLGSSESSSDSNSSEEETGAEGIAKLMGNIAGNSKLAGKGKGKEVVKAVEAISSNPDLTSKINTAFEKLQKGKSVKKSNKETFSEVIEDIYPVFEQAIEMMEKGRNGNNSSDESSSSDDTSSENSKKETGGEHSDEQNDKDSDGHSDTSEGKNDGDEENKDVDEEDGEASSD